MRSGPGDTRGVGPRLVARLTACWPAKLLGPLIGLTGFFVLYFRILLHPLFPVTVMPVTAVDHLITFQPWALSLYVSLWVYLLVAPGLMTRGRDLAYFDAGVVVLALVGLGIFVLWPTVTPAPDIDWTHYPGVAFLKRMDRSGNACPSLHAAFAVFTAIWNAAMLRRAGDRGPLRILNVLWCVAILYATLATKQHVLVDVLGGVALGALVALPHRYYFRQAPGQTPDPRAVARPGMRPPPASPVADDLE